MNVTKKKIFLSSPHMSDEGYEQKFVKEAFDSNWIAPLGNNVNEFEKELAEVVGAMDAAALTTGTGAIHLALKALGVGKDDIVLCSTLTFSATANPITYCNAIPVFIDSDIETWNMSPIALEKALKKYGRKVKAVILVHLYGLCAELDKIISLCKEYQVPLIEDAAESLGSTYHEKWTGTFGDYGIFSFNGNKIITTSGGGMLVCNLSDTMVVKERLAKVRFWATQSREPARHYQHEEIGYNYRMSNIVAGIGRGQLKVLKQRVEKKRYLFQCYYDLLSEYVDFMPMMKDTYSNCWLSCIVMKKNSTIDPLTILEALEKENIESRPIWKPLHMQPVFQKCDFIDNGSIAEELYTNGLCLPSDTKMTDEDIERVVQVVRRVFS